MACPVACCHHLLRLVTVTEYRIFVRIPERCHNVKHVSINGQIQNIFRRQRVSSSAFNERQLKTFYAVVSAVNHFGTDQPVRSEKIKIEVIHFAFVLHHAFNGRTNSRWRGLCSHDHESIHTQRA